MCILTHQAEALAADLLRAACNEFMEFFHKMTCGTQAHGIAWVVLELLAIRPTTALCHHCMHRRQQASNEHLELQEVARLGAQVLLKLLHRFAGLQILVRALVVELALWVDCLRQG